MRSRAPTLAVLSIVSIALAGNAIAQSDQGAEAEALFREGKRLLELQDFTNACPKLAESYRLDPATGALLALAVCHEGQGKTATAWAEYGDIASRSKAEGRNDRERAARERISALGPKLSTLTISVGPEASASEGFQVKRDGAGVSPAVWGLAIPVDPGTHVIEATAFGKKAWRTTLVLGTQADKKSVEISKLEELIQDDELGIGVPIRRPSQRAPSAPEPQTAPASSGVTVGAFSGSPAASHRVLPTVGIATIVAGGVALAIGGYYVSRALSKKSDYESDPTCTYDCPALDAANSAGNIATGFIVAGTVLVGAGVVLYKLAPNPSTTSVSFQIAPVVTADNWQLAAAGRF
jgi:hypothetical protein